MNREICRVCWLGTMEYTSAWKLQDELAEQVASGVHTPALLLLEHPPTYTFGRRGKIENLLWDEHELERRGIAVHWVDRGGDVTYHGPGQLIGYPLINIKPRETGRDQSSDTRGILNTDYVGYLRQLERVLVLCLSAFGIEGQVIPGMTGVWAGDRKIASIGVKVDARGVTRHGFALNVDMDMTNWEGIVACGLDGYRMTSLAELTSPVPRMDQVVEAVMTEFGEIFGYQMIRV